MRPVFLVIVTNVYISVLAYHPVHVHVFIILLKCMYSLHIYTLASDFDDTIRNVTISPGDTSAVVSIPIIDDNIVEGDERFDVVLQPQGNEFTIRSPGQAVVVITNDDGGFMQMYAYLKWLLYDCIYVIVPMGYCKQYINCSCVCDFVVIYVDAFLKPYPKLFYILV